MRKRPSAFRLSPIIVRASLYPYTPIGSDFGVEGLNPATSARTEIHCRPLGLFPSGSHSNITSFPHDNDLSIPDTPGCRKEVRTMRERGRSLLKPGETASRLNLSDERVRQLADAGTLPVAARTGQDEVSGSSSDKP
jgi:hypothetical protein